MKTNYNIGDITLDAKEGMKCIDDIVSLDEISEMGVQQSEAKFYTRSREQIRKITCTSQHCCYPILHRRCPFLRKSNNNIS